MIPQHRKCAYTSGMLPGGAPLPHPGGADLTLRAVDLASLPLGARVLDLGCGDGSTVKLLRAQGFEAIGIDQEPRPGVEESCLRRTADAGCGFGFNTGTFDAVMAECSLSLMPEPQTLLVQCARVLRPGGRIILCDLYARAPEAIQAVRLSGACIAGIFIRVELEAWLAQAGFVMDCFEDHSRELRETVARYVFEHGTIESLWGRAADREGAAITAAMKLARAGYFLCIATRGVLEAEKNGGRDVR